jgi:hypothetical protein
MSFYTSHPNIYNFVDVLLEVQSETYIKFRSKSVRTKKMYEKKAFVRKQMTELKLKEINNFELVKSLSFKFLSKQ